MSFMPKIIGGAVKPLSLVFLMDYFFYNHDLFDWVALKVGAYESRFTKNQGYDFAIIRDTGFAGYNSSTVLVRSHKTASPDARILSAHDLAVHSCVNAIKGVAAKTYKITSTC